MIRLGDIGKGTLVALLLAGSSLAGGSASAQSLEDAVRTTLETNPRIGAAASNREAISHELRQARSFYLPQLDVEARYGYGSFNDLASRNRPGDDDYLGTDPLEARVVLQQRLFDGFETDGRVAREKARTASASHRVYERSEFISLDAVNAYLEVLRSRELLALARENVEVHRNILDSLEQRAQRGVGDRANVVQTATRLGRAEATVSERLNQLRDAEAEYEAVVGEMPGQLTMPAFPDAELPPDRGGTLELVVDANPTIQVREADIRAAEAEVDVVSANFYPRVNIEADTAYREAFDGNDTYEHVSRIMVVMRWNLYSGGADTANRREALARVAEAKNERHQALRDAAREVQTSWSALENERQRVIELRRSVDFADETRASYLEQFRVAERTLLDVLDAENELFAVRSQLVTAENNLLFSKYRILALLGNLLNTLGIEHRPEADPRPATFSESLFD